VFKGFVISQPASHSFSARQGPLLLWLALGLVAGCFVAYAPIWKNSLVRYDDYVYIVDNEHVRDGLSADSIRWAFQTDPRTGNWHPLTWLSHMLDVSLLGVDSAAAQHGENLALHAINSVLLLWVLYRATGWLWPSAAVAAMFALHPINVESVAWAAQRKNVLSTLFWLLTMVAYLGYVRRGGWARYLLVAIFLTLGLMAKSMLVTLPAALLLLDFWPLDRWKSSTVRGLIVEKLPLAALCLMSSVVTFMAQSPARATLGDLPLRIRLANAVLAYATYLKKLVWPTDLAVIYPHPGDSLLEPAGLVKVALAAALLAIITWVAISQRGRRPYLLFGWLWYLGTLVPVIGLVHVGMQAMADRYVYVPEIGIFVMVCWTIVETSFVRRRPAFTAVLGVTAAVLYGSLTFQQVRTWRNSYTLFEHAVAVTSRGAVAHANLGYLLASERRYREAEKHLRRAVEFAPNDSDNHIQLAKVLVQLGQRDEALWHYDRAIELAPRSAIAHEDRGILMLRREEPVQAVIDFKEAIKSRPDSARLHTLLGMAYARQGAFTAAEKSLRRAMDLNPNADRRSTLARVYEQHADRLLQQDNSAEAARDYAAAIRLDPRRAALHAKWAICDLAAGDVAMAANRCRKALALNAQLPLALRTMARVLLARGEAAEAIDLLRQAVKLDPSDLLAANSLAWTLATYPDATLRSGEEAARWARRVCQATGFKDANFVATLAAAEAELGHFDQAARLSQQAAELSRNAHDATAAATHQARKTAYEARKPFRQRPPGNRPATTKPTPRNSGP